MWSQFTGRSTKTYKGGLKDLELKNKKITHYCQEGKTFSVLLLHIIKKEHLHIFWKNRRRSKIFIYTVIMSTPSPFPGQTYMYCLCPVCPSVTVTTFVSTISSVPLLHVPCILDTWLAPYKLGHDLLSVPLLHVPCILDTWLAPYKHGHDVLSVPLLHVPCILDTWLAPYKHGHDVLYLVSSTLD